MDIKTKLANYINTNFIEPARESSHTKYSSKVLGNTAKMLCECSNEPLNTFINDNKEDNKFQKLLFKHIDERDLKDSDVYNKVNIDRRLFSKIRNDSNYHPSKNTIILLAIALELSEDELLDLLNSAEYSLPNNDVFNLIVKFCFKEKIYNINTINEFLYDYNCKTIN